MNNNPFHTECDQRSEVAESAPPTTPQKKKRSLPRRSKKPPVSLVSVVIAGACGILTGLVIGTVFFFLFQNPFTSLQGDSSAYGDHDYNYGSDVETNEEADEAYSLPLYQGDTSALTIQLDNPSAAAPPASQVYAEQLPSTVSITVYAGSSAAYGSGMILTEDGFILTCAHVVDNTESAVITTSDDKEYQAALVGLDTDTDLAVLKIQAKDLRPVTFADSEQIVVGDIAYALGDSLGSQFRSSFTNGMISGLNRHVSFGNKAMTLLQTTVPVNSGNSGGPLFNGAGQVIGVVNMKKSSPPFGVSVDNMGLSIPSATVKTIVEQLAQNHTIERAVLGITCYTIDKSSAYINQIPMGLWVSTIAEGISDCDNAGLLLGDIITAVNGTPVESIYDVKDVLVGKNAGDTVTLTIWRDPDFSRELNFSDSSQDPSGESSSDASTDPADDFHAETAVQEYHYALYGDLTVKLISSADIEQ